MTDTTSINGKGRRVQITVPNPDQLTDCFSCGATISAEYDICESCV